MKKNVFLLVCMLFASNTFAQESTSPAVSSLTIYSEGNSGTLVDNTSGQFEGNELVLGAIYSHSIHNSVPWLVMFAKAEALGSIKFNHINLNTPQYGGTEEKYIMNPKYILNGYSSSSLGLKKLEIGVNVADYFAMSVQSDFQINLLAQYQVNLPANQHIKVSSYAEFIPFYIGNVLNGADNSLQTPGNRTSHSFKDFSFAVEYSIKFSENNPWAFATVVDLRSNGKTYPIGTQSFTWKIDSMDAFVSNMYVRWNNTISYTSPNGYSVWGQVRYTANNIFPKDGIAEDLDMLIGRTSHDINLRFGLSYLVDFTK